MTGKSSLYAFFTASAQRIPFCLMSETSAPGIPAYEQSESLPITFDGSATYEPSKTSNAQLFTFTPQGAHIMQIFFKSCTTVLIFSFSNISLRVFSESSSAKALSFSALTQ